MRYQPGKWDQFGHAYAYDAENRLTDYYTTRHNFTSGPLVAEAHYRYYMHGPLARMELGHQRVQGLDYAYTLQGWLKGVNSQVLAAANDMSGDGLSSSPFANVSRDVFGFSLGYYGRSGLGLKDYIPVGGSSANSFALVYDAPDETVSGTATGKSLFNGNISHATYAWSHLNGGQTNSYSYRYDQLNRLTAMRQHNLGSSPGTWSNSSIIQAYAEDISYDANGNILTYERKGANQTGMPLEMDKLSYVYTRDDAGRLKQNQLQQVKDAITETNYSESTNGTADIDNQSTGNYTYDRIGNLIADEAEGISAIRWNVYGKIASISKQSGQEISYGYDAGGNRITKSVIAGGATTFTYYVRDAQGNVMGVYSRKADKYQWEEQHLYGSSRVGMVRPQLELQESTPLSNANYNAGIETIGDGVEGKRVYELSNHLGNVLATISDRKIGVDDGGGPEIDYYIAEVLLQNDYYPGGMLMPGRKYSSSSLYRYGFNGKENDNEVKGEGGQQDYGMRIYDSRSGKFLSFDPLNKDYSDLSPYHFAGNNPVKNVDVDGGEPLDYRKNWVYVKMSINGGKGVWNDGEWSDIGAIRYEAVYDKVSKQHWFINQGNDGKSYYWKHNPGADQSVRIVSTTGAKDNGHWEEFETQDNIQARIRAESADLLAKMFVALFTAPFAIEAGAAGGSAAIGATATHVLNVAARAYMSYWRYAPAAGLAGRQLAEFLDESGSAGLQNAAVRTIEKFTAKQVSKFITTEEGALWQVDTFKEIIQKGGKDYERLMKDPIEAVIYNGKTYILDGHNRLKAFSELGKDVNVTILSAEEAMKNPKWKDIVEGGFKTEIGNDN